MKSARCMEYLIERYRFDDVIQCKEQNSLIGTNEDATIIVIYRQYYLYHYEDVDGRMKLIFQQKFFLTDDFPPYQFSSRNPTRLALNKKGDLLLVEIDKLRFKLYYKKAQHQIWNHLYSNYTQILSYQNQNNKLYGDCTLKGFNSQFSCFIMQLNSASSTTIILNIKNYPQIRKLTQSQVKVTDCLINEANSIIIGRQQHYLNVYRWRNLTPYQQINLQNGLLYFKFDQQNNLILLTKVHLEIYFQAQNSIYQKIAAITIQNNNQIYDIVPIKQYILIQRTSFGKNFAQVTQIENNTIQSLGEITCQKIITQPAHKFYIAIKEEQIEIYKQN